MASEKLWSYEKDEMLIELVREKPGLYNLQSPYYSDYQYKRLAWNEIEREVGLPGPKSRWEQLRSQYRKFLNKQKTNNGQSSTKIAKWRFAEHMTFLNEYINNDRPRITSLLENESDEHMTYLSDYINPDRSRMPLTSKNELDDDSQDDESFDRIVQNNGNVEVKVGNDSSNNLNTGTSYLRKKKRKYTSLQQENTSSTLMRYILQQIDEERAVHPVENFFSLMASTVKNFSPIDQHFVRKKVFDLISDIEEKYLTSSTSTSAVVSPTVAQHSLLSQAPSSQSSQE